MNALQTKSLLSIIDKSFCARQGTQQVSKVPIKDFAIDIISFLSEEQKLKIAYANNLTGSKSVYQVIAHEGDTYIHTTSSYKDAQNRLYYGEITEVKNYMPSDEELAMFFTSEFSNIKEILITYHSYDWELGIHSLTNATSGSIILEKDLSPDDFYLGRFYGFIPIYQ